MSEQGAARIAPPISVIMAAYNAEATISAATDSILAQSFRDFELIIVDDASTDDTPNIADAYARRDWRVRVLRQSINHGSGHARNIALAAARGEYVAVMDADDISVPDRLMRQLDEFAKDPQLQAVAGLVAEFGDWGTRLQESLNVASPEMIVERLRRGRMPINHPTVMYRRAAAVAVGGYDPACRRAQDLALFIKLADQAMKVIPEVLTYYRTREHVSLRYVWQDTYYAFLARLRNMPGAPTLESAPEGLNWHQVGRTAPVSLVRWLRRRLRENRSQPIADCEKPRA